MKNSSTRYENLLSKLDAFIRKYYINSAIRGALYWVGLALALYLVFTLLEYEFWFSSSIRKGMLFSFLAISLGSLFYWVIRPLASYFRLGKRLSDVQAATIIGAHFPQVQDKLLNVLQLKEQVARQEDPSLLLASIDQKTNDLSPIHFPEAIDLKKNKKYLKYALPPLACFLLIFLLFPYFITDGTARIMSINEEFEKPAPFHFRLDEDKLKIIQYSDLNLSINTEGEIVPEEAFISFGDHQYKLEEEAVGKFSYTFKNVQSPQAFRLISGEVESREYHIDVIGKPGIEEFSMHANYPAYTQRKDENHKAITDLIVPEGTTISWQFKTRHTDSMAIKHSAGSSALDGEGQNYSSALNLKTNQAIRFYLSGNQILNADSLQFNIHTINDKYPRISAREFAADSSASGVKQIKFFAGEASDDYGISALEFKYFITDQNGTKGQEQSIAIPAKSEISTTFDFSWDPADIPLKPGASISYYFQVTDNDAVNGNKTARTPIMTLKKPSLEETEEAMEENDQAIMEQLSKSLKKSQSLEKEIEKLKEKLLTKENLDWKDKKEMEKLLELREELMEEMERIKKKLEENQKLQEQQDPDMQEKEEKLQEMLDQQEEKSELEKMLEKIRELLNEKEPEKDESIEMLEEMEKEQKNQDIDLERLKELYKQLELEKELNAQLDKLDKLAEKQEQLAEETEKGEKEQEQLLEEQEKINEEVEKIKEKMNEVEKKNQKLSKPQDLGTPQKDMHNIQDDLQKGTDALQKGDNQKASEKQKDAAEKMKQMQEQMQAGIQGGQQQQMEEDMEVLRQLLENIVTLSFDQEDLMEEVKSINPFTVQFEERIREQFKLQDDFTIVEDSLRALSKRVFQLEAFVMEKVLDINGNFERSLKQLEERKVANARLQQHKAMTNLNDLAVMLSETMENMQMQMSQSMPGSQMCNKPGMGTKPNKSGNNPGAQPMDKITEGQEKLNEAMKKQAEENQKKGQQAGEKGGDSEQFAKMAKEQAQLRKMLRNHQKELQEEGKGSKALEEILKDMDHVETQLVNKKLTNEMLKRQEKILTRLLESDRAERQRKMDEKRKAETALEKKRKEMPPELEEYLRKRSRQIEGLRTISPSLLPFYKELTEEYYNSLGTN